MFSGVFPMVLSEEECPPGIILFAQSYSAQRTLCAGLDHFQLSLLEEKQV